MEDMYTRTVKILGTEGVGRLARSRVAVFGVGGVGGHVCEALARAGVGSLDLIDKDVVSPSNINRQIIAFNSTVGRYKVEVMKERIADINKDCIVRTWPLFFLPGDKELPDFSEFDYIVDAIDNVTAKIELVIRAQEKNVPIICSMGTGNKMHPELLQLADIYETSVCPLAKVMRRELKSRGVRSLKVVYSRETPGICHDENGKPIIGSLPFVPGTAGLIMAGEVIRNLSGYEDR